MIDFSIPPRPIQETARLYLKTVLSAFGFGFIEQCKNLSADVSREMKRIFRNALRDPDQWVGRIAFSDPVVLVRGLGYRSVAVLSKSNKTKENYAYASQQPRSDHYWYSHGSDG
ncbi:MAG: hypothetical protein ACJ07L_16510, partial [Opitutales bacterium]